MKKLVKIITAILLIVIFIYCMFVFSGIPPLKKLRNIWVETAMTTMNHQWLATNFIPDFIIDEIMSQKMGVSQNVAGFTYSPFSKTLQYNDVAHQADFRVGGNDSAGNRIIVNDPEQKIMISRAEIYNSVVVILQVDDASRVFLGTVQPDDETGIYITDFLERYDAIAGINASGYDASGNNVSGKDALGLSMSFGNLIGENHSDLDSICFMENDRLIAGKIDDWNSYNVRDGCQFKPIIITDGKKLIEDTGGYGINPRTCIAQRKDGSVLMLVCEGRNGFTEMGLSLGNAADILLDYGADIAAVLDGGSSAIMAYNGKLAVRNTSSMDIRGRKIPNAFLIKKLN